MCACAAPPALSRSHSLSLGVALPDTVTLSQVVVDVQSDPSAMSAKELDEVPDDAKVAAAQKVGGRCVEAGCLLVLLLQEVTGGQHA